MLRVLGSTSRRRLFGVLPACGLVGDRSFVTVPSAIPQDRLVTVQVDGREVQVPDSATVMQACAAAGIDVPRFCYHERLAVAGNCRMCLVQVNGGAKLVASCAAPIMPNMRIDTSSAPVKRAREGVMEFLLANHPLDCPICDQGGECDLQDQAMAFGSDRSRFRIDRQAKRAVEDKEFGPLIATSMNRCIHCTRCVRFANEVAGVAELGTTGRGNDMQIGTYISRMIDSELSGNVVDLCPVGALTSKPYAFMARPWELRHTDTVDVMDAVGSNIRVDSRGMEVLRILPRLHEQINEEWISDKTRFACDALRQQRLTRPLWGRRNPDGSRELVPISWADALQIAAEKIGEAQGDILAIIGPFADLESIFLLRQMLDAPAGNAKFAFEGSREHYPQLPAPLLPYIKMNTSIAGVEVADAILLVGCNPKKEAPILNARIRKTWLRSSPRPVGIGVVGLPSDLKYRYDHLGLDCSALGDLGAFAERLEQAEKPIAIVGQEAIFSHPNAMQTLSELAALARRYPRLEVNFLPTQASRTGALALGIHPQRARGSRLVYLLGADDFEALPPDAFVIYQGHHGDAGAQLADLVLPGAAYTEKDALYVNMEGRVQMTRAAVPPPGEAREDWSILRALSEVLRRPHPYDTPDQVREAIGRQHPHLSCLNELPPFDPQPLNQILVHLSGTSARPASRETGLVPYGSAVADFYLTDCISRNSPTMAYCSMAFVHGSATSEELETLARQPTSQ